MYIVPLNLCSILYEVCVFTVTVGYSAGYFVISILRPLYGGDLRVALNRIRRILGVKIFQVNRTFIFGSPDL